MDIHVNIIRQGQPRAYADSYYEYEVKFEYPVSERQIISFARFLRGDGELFTPDDKIKGIPDNYFKPHLSKMEKLDKIGKQWRILIVEHYCD